MTHTASFHEDEQLKKNRLSLYAIVANRAINAKRMRACLLILTFFILISCTAISDKTETTTVDSMQADTKLEDTKQEILQETIPIIELITESAKQSTLVDNLQETKAAEKQEAKVDQSNRSETDPRILALSSAYKEFGLSYALVNDDWVVKLKNKEYYFLDGRLLPSSEKTEQIRWSPHPWYAYPDKQNEPPVYSAAESAQLDRAAETQASEKPRNHSFYDNLWDAGTEASAWEQMKSVNFLGIRTTVHREILEDLSRVERDIQRLAARDPEVARFVKSIKEVQGYNWRRIAGSSNRSLHSYGVAIDLVPKSWGNIWVYWRWPADKTPWYKVPLNRRFRIPDGVVETYEAHGFVWGGKWLFFDDMHFEYRPEILEYKKFTRPTQ